MKKRNHLFSDALAALMFLSGLALASSDGEWMPWPNVAGIALLWGCLAIANARSRRPDLISPAPSTRLPVAAITGHVPPQAPGDAAPCGYGAARHPFGEGG